MTVPVWVLTILVSLCGLALTAMGFFYARIKSSELKARESGAIGEKLDHLKDDMSEIKTSMKQQQGLCSIRGERLALVEASAKSAHLRIDELAGVVRKGDPHAHI